MGATHAGGFSLSAVWSVVVQLLLCGGIAVLGHATMVWFQRIFAIAVSLALLLVFGCTLPQVDWAHAAATHVTMTTTTVLGTPVSSPVLVAPVGYQRLAPPEGELATAEGVRRAGGFMVVSTRSSTRIEDVATELAAPWWFQTYVMRDRARTVDLVRRAAASGFGGKLRLQTVVRADGGFVLIGGDPESLDAAAAWTDDP